MNKPFRVIHLSDGKSKFATEETDEGFVSPVRPFFQMMSGSPPAWLLKKPFWERATEKNTPPTTYLYPPSWDEAVRLKKKVEEWVIKSDGAYYIGLDQWTRKLDYARKFQSKSFGKTLADSVNGEMVKIEIMQTIKRTFKEVK